jgi:Rrf2 family nitric oxide-sensitive transcriptional repressor
MHLTDFTDYTVRALMYLAMRHDLATIDEIARATAIPRNHLTKIVCRMSAAGWIETVRGRRGGARLGKSARHLTIGQIVRECEGEIALANCDAAKTDIHCVIAEYCRLRHALWEAKAAFFGALDQCSLGELVAGADELGQAFGIVRFMPASQFSRDVPLA